MATKRLMLAYMDYATHTGFASVSQNLMQRLLPFFHKNNIEVHMCATNYLGEPYVLTVGDATATVFSAKSVAKNMNDLWYRDGMLKILAENPYEFLWVMNDIPVMSPTMQLLKKIREEIKPKKQHPNFKSVLYTPIDSKPNPEFMNDLDFWNLLVTYTNYGQKEIHNAVGHKQPVSIIPHGVDKKDYYKIASFDKHTERAKYKLPVESFIFGNINKNSSRKNIGGTLLAFYYFLERYRLIESDYNYIKPALYLHMSPTDSTGIDIYRACKQLGISEYVHFPEKEEYKKGDGYTVQEMNEVYNCLDCYVTTTTAEGWGLTVTEAMACELPIVAPMHTSLKEITENGDACYAVTVMIEHFQIADYENIRHIPDPVITANQMLIAFKDVCHKKFPHKEAYEDILEKYDWDKIAKSWEDKFNKLL
jgi:glycosyltransferase involved in cell wall biosynthesis